jgi:Mg2+/Co2+ transporter CorB
LLSRPDRLIGLILLGNNFVNILITQLATLIGYRLYGNLGIAIAGGVLTLVILILAEVAPKTLAALHSERVAYPSAFVYVPLLTVLQPVVWTVNLLANSVLRLFRVPEAAAGSQALSREELRTVVREAGSLIPRRHQHMLISILDLEKATVEDIMVPRNEIVGIDLEDEWDDIVQQIIRSSYTRVPVFRGSIDNVEGFLHLRNVLPLIHDEDFQREDLEGVLREASFIPEGTPLNRQLLNFQRERRRMGLVVDEYGEIMGLVTLEDLLEEIVGEFTSDPSDLAQDVTPQEDGSYLVDGGTHIRVLNRVFGLHFRSDGPRTVNGLVLEHMEAIPETGTTLLIDGYPVEIVQSKNNAVKTVRVKPRLAQYQPENEQPHG